MKKEQKDIIIFTGQSGIKIDSCLTRLANNGLQFQTIQIDKIISQIIKKDFIEVLEMPPKIQETLWTEAFQSSIKNIPAQVEKDKYIFLTFHACYFHQRKTEFISPVNLNELMQLKNRTKMVIILIDDCYDVYRHLLDDGQMYNDVLTQKPLESLMQSVMNISNLLMWREVEIAFSRKIAQLLNVPMYCISVKHPTFLVSRLISKAQSDLNILYLSHPISAIRKQAMGERLSAFYAELNNFIQEVLKYENMILFIPDTIDEYRIKIDSVSGNYVPELLDGWLIPYPDDLICEHLPLKLREVNPLNPNNFLFSTADGGTKSAISSILNMLSLRIKDQVNARDHTLVEQGVDGVLVYRPYWAASFPHGVEEEMKYNYDLKVRYGDKKRKAYLLSAYQDLGKWRISKLFTLLEDSAIISAREKEGLKSLLQKWSEDTKKVSEFSSKSYNMDRTRTEIESILPGDYEFDPRFVGSFKGALSPAKMLQKVKLLDRGWEEIFSQINADDPLLRYTDEECILLSDRKKFDEEARGFIKNVIVGRA